MSSKNEWPMVKLGEIAEIGTAQVKPESLDGETVYLGLEHLKKNGGILETSDVATAELKSSKYAFTEEAILFGKLRPNLRKIAVPNFSGVCSTDRLPIYSSEKVNRSFLYHYLLSESPQAYIQNRVTGINLPRTSPKALRELQVPLPPLDEQQRIAEILDQVENLKKLNEEQYLLLSSSLGRSLIFELASLNAPSVKLSDISTISSGSTPSRKKSGYYGGSIPWVKTNEVNGREIFDTEEKLTELGLKESSCKIYAAGTVLIAMYGQGATRGQAGLLGVRAATNQACASVVPHDLEDSEFIFEALKANYEQLRSLGRGGTQPNLNLSLVKDFQIPYPSKEQRQEFRERIAAVHKIKLINAERLAKLTEVSQALKTRAFAGQL